MKPQQEEDLDDDAEISEDSEVSESDEDEDTVSAVSSFPLFLCFSSLFFTSRMIHV